MRGGGFTSLQKLAIALALVGLVGAGYFFLQSRATTEIALTLTTNPDLERGLVGHWTFDGNDVDWSSTTAEIRDRSGNNYHIEGQDGLSRVDSAPGVLGQGINFDGTTWSLQHSTMPYTFSDTSFSVAFWFKTTDTTTSGFFVSYDACDGGWGITLNSGTVGGFLKSAGSCGNVPASRETSTGEFNDDAWHHALLVFTTNTASSPGNDISIYIDGVLNQGSVSRDGSVYAGPASQKMQIMGRGSYSLMDASMDDVRIYNRVLSAEEVKRLYQLGATTKVAQTLDSNTTLETGLVGHWTFDGPMSSGIPDVSGNGYTGYFMSSVSTTSALAIGSIGQAVFVDGIDEHFPYADTVDNMSTFTMCAWVRPEALSNADGDPYMDIVSKGGALRLNNSGRYEMHVPTTGIYGWVYSSSFARLREWQHVCGIHYNTSTDPALYFNGAQEIYGPQGPSGTLPDNSTLQLYMGATSGNSTYATFYGGIDDVRVYNRALSAEEIRRLYALGGGVTIDGFVCGQSMVQDADLNTYDTLLIGSQCWMKQNMRVGTRISTSTSQTNNGIIEYYCIDNLDSNCTDNHPNYPDGGLYRWNEAMQYSTTEGAQGICPSGWHIPSHDEWTTLERAVCTSGTCATDFPYDTTTVYSWRGTDEGDKLGPNGSSGFEGNYAASFFQGEIYGARGIDTYMLSSTQVHISNVWGRNLDSSDDRVYRGEYDKNWAQSVRCLKDS